MVNFIFDLIKIFLRNSTLFFKRKSFDCLVSLKQIIIDKIYHNPPTFLLRRNYQNKISVSMLIVDLVNHCILSITDSIIIVTVEEKYFVMHSEKYVNARNKIYKRNVGI